MAAWGYKFYLLVLKVSLTSERNERVRDFQHEKIKFVSPRSHVISSISFRLTRMCLIVYSLILFARCRIRKNC